MDHEPDRHEKITRVLAHLCGTRPPADVVQRWLDHEQDDRWGSLQDWVGMQLPADLDFAATIAVIEAAEHIADEPRE